MRIGILTYHCVPNFGAQLQAMSTVGYLKKMGHTPVLLHWYPIDLENLYARMVPKNQRACHMQFAQDNFQLSLLCRNEKQLIREIEKQQLDMIITGSDALFRYVPISNRKREFSKRKLRYVNNYLSCEDLDGNPFFCGYYGYLSKQIPVVAFSVSSQSCPYTLMNYEEQEKMGRYIQNFKKITVRDQWTKQMIENIAGLNNIQVTPDPVFSFNQNVYIQIPSKEDICSKYNIPENYALISLAPKVLKTDYLCSLRDCLLEHEIRPVFLPEPEGKILKEVNLQIQLPLSPIDWYALIKHSKAYIGTRMHPIIVSLHNSIPFFSFDGNGFVDQTGEFVYQSSKVYAILNMAGLMNNTFPLKSNLPIPSADYVQNVVSDFNKERCQAFADSMYKNYVKGMSWILET
jgi:polysaccharide pyruvyl transferase WcaK-like protein